MDLNEVRNVCRSVFGERGGEEKSQKPTGAVGHIKAYPINGDGTKILFVALQGGPYKDEKILTCKRIDVSFRFRYRYVDDCRNKVVTRRHKSEWTGYHAEMIIVSRWIKLIYPAISPDKLKNQLENILLFFKTRNDKKIIAANAPCCLHCHNMLAELGIEHPVPESPKASNTGWWNPLTDKVVPNADGEFRQAIPGMK